MSKIISRQTAIRRIISLNDVVSQDDILSKLAEEGHVVTQATLSRDLKVMQIVKVSNGTSYKYVLPDLNLVQKAAIAHSGSFFADGFRGIEFSQNIAVIKTKPAFASGIAAYIDEASVNEILGCVAGDDTIMVVLREGVSSEDFKKSLLHVLPTLEGRL
ncbi:MAG: arginine repressor [Mangrovibacterium sp.]